MEAKSSVRFDLHRSVTDRIVEAIEAGAASFIMPWHRAASAGRPINAATGSAYRGINVLVLWAETLLCGYGSQHWATYRQWLKLGAQVRRGQHGTVVVFYKRKEGDPSDEDEVSPSLRLIARASRVFNADQVAGWRPDPPAEDVPVAPALEQFVQACEAVVRHGGDIACYQPADDVICMPEPEAFIGSPTRSAEEAYHAVLLHELTHWSGGPSRLNRAFGARFGDDAYAIEELVAELGSAFLCADLGLSPEPRHDHAAYLAGWLKVLKADSRAVFLAARQAHVAAAYLWDLATPPAPT